MTDMSYLTADEALDPAFAAFGGGSVDPNDTSALIDNYGADTGSATVDDTSLDPNAQDTSSSLSDELAVDPTVDPTVDPNAADTSQDHPLDFAGHSDILGEIQNYDVNGLSNTPDAGYGGEAPPIGILQGADNSPNPMAQDDASSQSYTPNMIPAGESI